MRAGVGETLHRMIFVKVTKKVKSESIKCFIGRFLPAASGLKAHPWNGRRWSSLASLVPTRICLSQFTDLVKSSEEDERALEELRKSYRTRREPIPAVASRPIVTSTWGVPDFNCQTSDRQDLCCPADCRLQPPFTGSRRVGWDPEALVTQQAIVQVGALPLQGNETVAGAAHTGLEPVVVTEKDCQLDSGDKLVTNEKQALRSRRVENLQNPDLAGALTASESFLIAYYADGKRKRERFQFASKRRARRPKRRSRTHEGRAHVGTLTPRQIAAVMMQRWFSSKV